MFFVEGLQIAKMEERVERLKYLNDIIHQVKIETYDGMDYWFDKDDDEFLAQGRTADEIIAVLKSRFPEHVFLLGELGGVGKKTDWKIMKAEELKDKLTKENLLGNK